MNNMNYMNCRCDYDMLGYIPTLLHQYLDYTAIASCDE